MQLKVGDILVHPDMYIKMYIIAFEGNLCVYNWNLNETHRYRTYTETIFDKGWRHISKLEKALQ